MGVHISTYKWLIPSQDYPSTLSLIKYLFHSSVGYLNSQDVLYVCDSLGCNVTSDQTKMMQILYTCGSKRPKSKSGWIQRGGGFVSLTIMVYYDFLVSDSLHIFGLHLVGSGFVFCFFLLLLVFVFFYSMKRRMHSQISIALMVLDCGKNPEPLE